MREPTALSLRLRQTREKLNLSLDEFGEKLGCCKSSVINYESGKRVPGARYLIDIVNTFGISPDWILMGRGEMFGPLPYLGPRGKNERDLELMLEHLQIPTMKLAILAEYHRLKNIFKPLVDEFEELKEKNERKVANE